MSWFNCGNDDRRKRDIEDKLRSLRWELDSICKEKSHAGDMWYESKGQKGRESECEYWHRVEDDLGCKQYYINREIRDLENELRY